MDYSERIQYLGFLKQVEKKYKCEDFIFMGLHIWPLLTTVIMYIWRDAVQINPEKIAQRNTSNKWNSLIRFMKGWYHISLNSYKRSDYLFVGDANFNTLYKNQYINRYFDPILDALEADKMIPILFEKTVIGKRDIYKKERMNDLFSPFIYFWNSYNGRQIRKKINTDTIQKIHPHLNLIINELAAELHINNTLIYKRIIGFVQKVIIWKKVFDSILNKVKPQYSFLINYASAMGYGFVYACKSERVKVTDIQHGAQGKMHWAYLGFDSYPPSGYNSMPDYFWVWDANSENFLMNEFKRCKSINVIHGGNPWLSFLMEKGEIYKMNRDRKIILITLQPIEPIIEDFVLDSIKHLDNQYEFWIRFHPRMNDDHKSKIKKLFIKKGLTNLEFDKSNSLPLQQLIFNCEVHISYYSGSIIEASLMNKPSIVLHRIGTTIFEQEIAQNIVFPYLLKEKEKLSQLILYLSDNNKKVKIENIDFLSILKDRYS